MKRRKNKKPQADFIMNSWIAKFISIVTVLFFFGYIAGVTFYPVFCCNHPINMEFVNLAIGWIGGVATTVITFFFGSSSQSAEKNELINKALNKNNPQSINITTDADKKGS
jgi:polyferredoxin